MARPTTSGVTVAQRPQFVGPSAVFVVSTVSAFNFVAYAQVRKPERVPRPQEASTKLTISPEHPLARFVDSPVTSSSIKEKPCEEVSLPLPALSSSS
jgi:hypothetical protein